MGECLIKMGFVNYLINEEKKIAIEISRYVDDNTVNLEYYDEIEELITYINRNIDELNIDILKYLLDKCCYCDYDKMFVIYMMSRYKFNKIIHEDKLPKDYVVIGK